MAFATMLTFKPKSFLIFVALLSIEIAIAVFVHDTFIRPFFGDFLAVITLYFLLKSFLKLPILTLAFISIMVAYTIELVQYFNFLAFSGLKKHKIVAIVLGSSFDWKDILAYTLGILVLIFSERKTSANR
jgi:Protein of unknown function (DUF2809)